MCYQTKSFFGTIMSEQLIELSLVKSGVLSKALEHGVTLNSNAI
jgi:hypothetical protein